MPSSDLSVSIPRAAPPSWTPQIVTRECLAGVVTALALIPEVISFSVIAGVSPEVSLLASVVLCLVMSVLGGRTAMVTAAAGSVALVIGPMVHAHGVDYVVPAVVLGGLIQFAFGAARMARLARYIPRSVMTGFVNALGVLIFCAQVPHVLSRQGAVITLFVMSVLVVVWLPRLSRAIPSALVAIVAATLAVYVWHLHVPNVGGEGSMRASLPGLVTLTVPVNWQTLQIIWPTAVAIAFVGLLETLLTAQLVDEITSTRSHKSKESWALGVANVLAGILGGIGGCAMIGQTIVNVRMGGARTRLSTIAAGLTLLILITTLSPIMAQIPMVALAAVMMVVAVQTVDWHSLSVKTLRKMPVSETLVMVVTVLVTLVSSNLALGVACGVVLAVLLFARNVAQVIEVQRYEDVQAGVQAGTHTGVRAGDEAGTKTGGETVRYVVIGPLFFASSNELYERFDYERDPKHVDIDMTRSRVWDASSIAALDAITHRYAGLGKHVRIIGLDTHSEALHQRVSGQVKA